MLKDFLKDLVGYLPAKVVPGILGFVLIPVMTRLFDPGEYGQYVIVATTLSVLNIVAFDWIGPSITRFYAEYQRAKSLRVFNGTVIRLSLASIVAVSIVSYLLLFIFKGHLTNSLYHYLHIGLVILPLSIAFNTMAYMLYVKRQVKLYSLLIVWRQSGCILLGVLIVTILNLGVVGLLWGIAIGIGITLPFLARLTFKQIGIKDYSKKLCRDIIMYGSPLIVTNLAAWILTLSDRYIIEHFRGSQEVGLYAISYTLADNSVNLIGSLVALASAPIVIGLWETQGIDDTRLFIHDMTKYYIILALPAAMGLSVLSEILVRLLTTSAFHRGYVIMPMVAASVFLYGLQRSFQLGLLFHKKTRLIMYILLSSGILNVLLNIMLIPKYGFIAAGYSVLISYLILTAMMIHFSRKYFTWKFPFGTLLRSTIAVVIMGLIVHYVLELTLGFPTAGIVLSVGIGAIVYFCSLILMGEINRNTLNQLNFLLGKKQGDI
jgi:O-antigen/teichoic acid export membrane protein